MASPSRHTTQHSLLGWKTLLLLLVVLAAGVLLVGSTVEERVTAALVKHGSDLSRRAIEQHAEEIGRDAALRTALIGGALVFVAVISMRLSRRTMKEVAGALRTLEDGELPEEIHASGWSLRADLSDAVNRATRAMHARLTQFGREESERNTILSGMAEGIVGVDPDSRVVLVNSAAREMLLATEGDPTGRSILELTRAPEVTQTLQRCLAEGIAVVAEATISGAEGERVLQLDARPLADEVRGAWGCVLVMRDLSELRRLEQVRSDFVANVSHELKTPLTAMRAHLETVLDDPDMPADVRGKFLEKAATNTMRLSAIVSDLLSIARFESDEVSMEMQRVELLEIVESAVRDARSSAEMRQVAIELAPLPGALPVYANREALRTAISNLIENAIKYSPPEAGVRLVLESRDGRARVCVEDEGPGIPAAEQERIFERFYRVDKARSRDLGGTGLGLSIVRNVMRRHGGEVRVESQVGRGSRFLLELPLAV